MSEQQWRVIADRDKGDDPKIGDAEDGDLLAFRKGREFETDYLVRIERPVPTADEHEPIDTLNLGYYRTRVQCSCGRSWWFGEHEGDPTHDEAKIEHEQPSPHPPTREQIALAIAFATDGMTEKAWANASQDYCDEMLAGADAVLALIQNGADR